MTSVYFCGHNNLLQVYQNIEVKCELSPSLTLPNLKSTDIPDNRLILPGIYCTLIVPDCTFNWLPLYPTVPFYTFLLTCSVSHCTPLHSPTGVHFTPLHAIVQGIDQHSPQLYATVQGTDQHLTYSTPLNINFKYKIFKNDFSMIISSMFICMHY